MISFFLNELKTGLFNFYQFLVTVYKKECLQNKLVLVTFIVAALSVTSLFWLSWLNQ